MKTKRRTDEPDHAFPLQATSPREAQHLFGADEDPADRFSARCELGVSPACQRHDFTALPPHCGVSLRTA